MTRIAGYAQIAFGVLSIALIALNLIAIFDFMAISVSTVEASLHDTYFVVPNLFTVGWSLTGSLLLIFGGLLLRKRSMAAE